MTFGTAWGWGSDKEASRRVFDMYVDAGGNFIDTANNYTNGESEQFVGEFLEGRRDELVVATKYSLTTRRGDANAGGNHRKNLFQTLDASLKRLQTDHVDLLWIHAWDGVTPIDEVMRALDDVVRAGKVHHVGFSNPTAWIAAQANTLADMRGWAPFVGVQVQYSLLQRDIEREILPMSRALGIGVVPWSPLGGGLLTGKYARVEAGSAEGLDESLRFKSNKRRATERNLGIVEELIQVAEAVGRSAAQVAIRWAMQRPGVDSVILGARTPAQLEDNLGAAAFELSAEDMARLDAASAIELGYPHDFLQSGSIQRFLSGETSVEHR